MKVYDRSVKLTNDLPDSLKIMASLDHELSMLESIEQLLIQCRTSALPANASTGKRQKAEENGRRDFKRILSDNRLAEAKKRQAEKNAKRKIETELRIGILSAAYAVEDSNPFELVGKFPASLIPEGNGEQFLRLAVDVFGIETVKTMLAEY